MTESVYKILTGEITMYCCQKCHNFFDEIEGTYDYSSSPSGVFYCDECYSTLKLIKTEKSGIPDFLFCFVCLNARDIYENVDGIWVVEECDQCGNEHYQYPT